MMNDELKKALQKLLSNPANVSADDIAVKPESMEDALAQKVEAPSEEDMTDEGAAAVDPALAAMAKATAAKSDANMAELPTNKYQGDSDVTKALRKLKAGQEGNLDELEDQDVQPEVIDDPQAPMELRKAAMERVKNKYLGR